MRHAYPMMLDVSERMALIVGGGAVAVRKAQGLLQAGATRVRVVSPAFAPTMPAAVERVEDHYNERYLHGAGLVFAATDNPEVNDAVVRDARRLGLLVNRADADEADPGDFATAALLRCGSVCITVAAGSPALAATIRDTLRDTFDPRWELMADVMLALRPRIRSAPALPAARRAEIFRELASPAALARASDGPAGVFEWLCERYPELKHA